MDLQCAHIVLNVTDVARARVFYIDQMGFEKIEDHPQSFAFRAGSVRYTVTPGGRSVDERASNTSMIFRTMDIERSVEDLRSRGVVFTGEIMEAPGFMKFIPLVDPDNNPLMLGQYTRDPLASV